MSHSVIRGAPYASQLYLDAILDEVMQSGVTGARSREEVNLPQILFYCLRKNPNDVFMTNAASGEKITNAQIIKHAVSIARALVSKGARGKNVMILMRNHQHMVAVYFAVLLAGTVPFIMDPNNTVFEITHFLRLIEPSMVLCDEEQYSDVITALKGIPEVMSEVKMADTEERLKVLANGCSEDPENFQIPDIEMEATVMMLPTSGSTGLPKATLMTHRGLVIQLPLSWCYHSQFPTPSECCMLLTTPQWVTFTLLVTTCTVYRVPLLMSQRIPTVQWVIEMLLKYRPSWTFFGPAFVKSLSPFLTTDLFSSLKTLLVLGAPTSIEIKTALREKLPPSAVLGDVYGTTETQGFITSPAPGVPLRSTGPIVNIFQYKILDDNGKQVEIGQSGELYIRGPSTIKGYYKNQASYDETFEDGWFKTGDRFYSDAEERLFYHERKKFCFKFMGCHVSPEEVERVISSVPGVKECAVSSTARGPAAIVVRRVGSTVTREQIHKVVNGTLSEHKRLHGGIAFVPTLPHTQSGKLKREDCKTLVHDLLNAGECF